MCQVDGLIQHLIIGHDVIHDSPVVSFLRRDGFCDQHEFHGELHRDLLSKAEKKTATCCRKANTGLGQAENRIVRSNREIACGNDLHAAAESFAMHRRDDRLVERALGHSRKAPFLTSLGHFISTCCQFL